MANKKSNLMWLLVFVAAVVLFGGKFDFQAVYSPEDVDAIFFAGTSSGSFLGYQISIGETRLGEPTDYDEFGPPFYCLPNTCNGVYDHTDEFGCEIWTGSVTRSVGQCSAVYPTACSFVPSSCSGTLVKQCIAVSPSECFECTLTSSKGYAKAERGTCTLKASCKETISCGGLTPTFVGTSTGCGHEARITKDGTLVWESNLGRGPVDGASIKNIILKDGVAYQLGKDGDWWQLSHDGSRWEAQIVDKPTDYDFIFDYGGKSYSYSECTGDQCENEVKECADYTYSFDVRPLRPEINFDVNSELTFFTGQEAYVYLTLDQNWRSDLKGELAVKYSLDTALGTVSDTVKQPVDLDLGSNIVPVRIPTEQVTELITIEPSLELRLDNSVGSGAMVSGSKCRPESETSTSISSCTDGIVVGNVVFPTKQLQIAPRPLFIEVPPEGCPIGYELNADGLYCIRDDIRDLTCFQIGCPTITGHDYECTSAGICAEVVFVYKDCTTEGCPDMNGATVECLSNGVCRYIDVITNEIILEKIITCADDPSYCPSGTTCDVQAQVCIKSEIYTDLIQCSSESDCLSPCEGIAIACVGGRCIYSGDCESREIDCKDVGCPEEYTCTQQGVCVKTTDILKSCGELGCPAGLTCNVNTGVCEAIEYQSRNCEQLGCPDGYECDPDRGVCILVDVYKGPSSILEFLAILAGIFVLYLLFEAGPNKGLIKRKR